MLLCIICSYFANFSPASSPNHCSWISIMLSPLCPDSDYKCFAMKSSHFLTNGGSTRMHSYPEIHSISPPHDAKRIFVLCSGSTERQRKNWQNSLFQIQFAVSHKHTNCPVTSIIHQLYLNILSFCNDSANIKCWFLSIDYSSMVNNVRSPIW